MDIYVPLKKVYKKYCELIDEYLYNYMGGSNTYCLGHSLWNIFCNGPKIEKYFYR